MLSIDEEMEELKAAKLEDARAFYKKFYGASNGALAVVGDFDAAEVKKAASELFGAWKSPAKFEEVKTGFQRIRAGQRVHRDAGQGQRGFHGGRAVNLSDRGCRLSGHAVRQLHVRRRVPQFPPGFAHPRERRVELRHRVQLFSAKSDDKDGQLEDIAIARSENVAKVEADFKEELDKALKDGFPQKEMDADRNGWLQSRTLHRAEDGSLVRCWRRATTTTGRSPGTKRSREE